MMDLQRTPDWHQARLGRVTASRVRDVLSRGPRRRAYLAELVRARLTGRPSSSFTNEAMQWGIDHEPEARLAYAACRQVEVAEVGFVDHPAIPMSGASPDGLVGDDGLVEIKCPASHTHEATLAARTVPNRYVPQILWQLACTDRAWCDFVSYDPRATLQLRMFVKRFDRDDLVIRRMEAAVQQFLMEVDHACSESDPVCTGARALG